ncbi:phosphatidylserine/phosphatidylglycerophosphate/cardiolipin synthase family protein, partial [Mesorhizobium sp. M8A.F.Ca.ET.021.01.1.1]
MNSRTIVILALFGLAALAGCAGAGSNACDFLAGQEACARPSLSAGTPGPQVAAAWFFGNAIDSDYERRFLALLANNQLGAMDRANGTGPFGRNRRDVQNRDFQATYSTLRQLAGPVANAHLPPASGGGGDGHFDGRWRVSRQTLYI